MEFKTVLFDFDGTVANTLPLCIHGFQAVFKKYDDRSIDPEGVVAMFGPSDDGMIIKNFHHKENIAKAIELYYQIYENEHQDFVARNSDILNLLNELRNREINVGVITGKSRRAYQISEKALGFKGLFESVVTGDDVAIPKPDPSGILQTLSKFDASKETSIYIGDSNSDILAGKAAGIHTAAVQWLPVTQSSSYPSNPDFYWTKVDDFMRLLD
ncbi:HAD family hydrolase [Sporolactobacillus pectinivorans]|uniref:HAD family hydrolase n=1 Tax=Sporolactobacillus pectinivorans TaxID=1591408 RepID=UPI000C2596CD|nr:HAD family hydrolase [Sporolactobacillus pectinivorans]